MDLLTAIIVLVFIVAAFWANNTYITPSAIRLLFNILLVVVCVAIILNLTGVFSLHEHVGR
jgi:hypothetical protein